MSRLLRAANRLLVALLIATGTVPAAAQSIEGEGALRPALLDATVNGQRSDEPTLFLRGPGGALYVAAETLGRWRMRLPPGEPVRFEGGLFYKISASSAMRVSLSEADQAVTIDAGVALFETQQTSLAPAAAGAMSPPASGAFLDYDLVVEHSRGETHVGGAFRLGLFTRFGVGETAFVASAGAGSEKVTRLDTSWTIDRPENATTIRIGDSVSSGGPGAPPVRFGGIQYNRNFAIQPGFITMPLPVGAGSAAIPSVVDIYVDNALQGSQQVAPGPFEIANIPVHAGGGNVQIVVRDLLGRQIVTEMPYYASTLMLRRGLHDFSWEAGFLRRRYGQKSNQYGSAFLATTHRYGISNRVTGEAHLQLSEKRRLASVGLNLLLFDLGQLGGSVSISHTERGLGYRASASFERRTRRFSLGVRGEYVSPDFDTLGSSAHLRPPRYTLQGFLDFRLWRGAVGMNLLHRESRTGRAETLAGLSGTFQVARAASVQLYARHSVAGRSETLIGAHLSFAFGGGRSLSAGIEHDRKGVSAHGMIQNNLPAGTGGAWRLAASIGRSERVEAAYVHNLPMATLGAQVGYARGAAGVRLSAAGSIGYMDRRLFASRSLGESFATVRVDGFPGLRVYADDQLVGVTGRDGALIVPRLRPFEVNRIRIEDADLPIDAQVQTLEKAVRPFARTGTLVRFAIRRERGVLLRVRREDGSALPAGALVRGPDGAAHVVVSGGEIYIPNLEGSALLRATWGRQACVFRASVPDNDDPQPLLDGLVCRREPVYASN